MILILGNNVVSLQYSTYYLAMANGHTKTNIILSSCMLLVMAPSVYVLTKAFGLNATPVPYLAINIVVTAIMAYVLINKFLTGTLRNWIVNSVLPIIVSCIVVAPSSIIVKSSIQNPYVRIGIACLVGTLCIYVITIIYIRIYPEIKNSSLISKFTKLVPSKWI